MQLRGDNFAPTEALACRYALERGTTDGAGGTAPDPAYLPATFVSVHEVLCAAPPVPAHISRIPALYLPYISPISRLYPRGALRGARLVAAPLDGGLRLDLTLTWVNRRIGALA